MSSENKWYGNFLIGFWSCQECHYEIHPMELEPGKAEVPPMCPKCNIQLVYYKAA
jgi:NAD-dependent SIR2 family protein deacetylase